MKHEEETVIASATDRYAGPEGLIMEEPLAHFKAASTDTLSFNKPCKCSHSESYTIPSSLNGSYSRLQPVEMQCICLSSVGCLPITDITKEYQPIIDLTKEYQPIMYASALEPEVMDDTDNRSMHLACNARSSTPIPLPRSSMFQHFLKQSTDHPCKESKVSKDLNVAIASTNCNDGVLPIVDNYKPQMIASRPNSPFDCAIQIEEDVKIEASQTRTDELPLNEVHQGEPAEFSSQSKLKKHQKKSQKYYKHPSGMKNQGYTARSPSHAKSKTAPETVIVEDCGDDEDYINHQLLDTPTHSTDDQQTLRLVANHEDDGGGDDCDGGTVNNSNVGIDKCGVGIYNCDGKGGFYSNKSSNFEAESQACSDGEDLVDMKVCQQLDETENQQQSYNTNSANNYYNNNISQYHNNFNNQNKKNNKNNNNRGKFNNKNNRGNRGGNRGGYNNNNNRKYKNNNNNYQGNTNKNDKLEDDNNATNNNDNNTAVYYDCDESVIDADDFHKRDNNNKNCNNKVGFNFTPWANDGFYPYRLGHSGGGGKNNNNNNNNNNNKNNNNNNQNKNNNCNKNSGGGGGGGGGSNTTGGGDGGKFDMLTKQLKQLCYGVGLLRHTNGPGYTLESLCLQFHYRLLVSFFFAVYLMVALKWHTEDHMNCIHNSLVDQAIKKSHAPICLSYSYVEREGERHYLLFYRWVSYGFLIASVALYCLRCGLVKRGEDPKLAKLWNDVWADRQIYDPENWRNSSRRVLQYLATGQASSLQYYKLIACHLIANVLVLAIMYFFDFALQGDFLKLVPNVIFNLERDPETFSDPLSEIFPPFVTCTIEDVHMIQVGRVSTYGCHLLLMEVYEKVFIVSWIMLAVHWLWSLLMMLWLSIRLLPVVGKVIFVFTEGMFCKRTASMMWKVTRECDFNEIYVLHLMSRWMSRVQFVLVIKSLLKMKEIQNDQRIKGMVRVTESQHKENLVMMIENYYSKCLSELGEKAIDYEEIGEIEMGNKKNGNTKGIENGNQSKVKFKHAPTINNNSNIPSAPPAANIGWVDPKKTVGEDDCWTDNWSP